MLDLTDENLARLKPGDVREYAQQHGWKRTGTYKKKLAIFNRNDTDPDQLLVPMTELDDYSALMRRVLAKLSAFENRPSGLILSDLFSVYADTLRYSVSSPETATGMLSLVRGVDLLAGARRSLLSAACSVLAPNSVYHARLSRSEADRFLETCELGQTEQGSFTVTVRCPLAGGEGPDPQLDLEEEPFARRATSTLLRSAHALSTAIDNDQIDTLTTAHTLFELPRVTGNLCEALLQMQPSSEQGILSLSASWASARPLRDRISNVSFRADHFRKIDWLYRQLRPTPSRQAAPFVGQVDELRGDIADSGQREGEVRMSIINEGEVVKVRARLSSAQYKIASAAHMDGSPVVVAGLLERRPRLSVIGDITRFERMV